MADTSPQLLDGMAANLLPSTMGSHSVAEVCGGLVNVLHPSRLAFRRLCSGQHHDVTI